MKRTVFLLAVLALLSPSAVLGALPAPTGVAASVDSCWGIHLSWDALPGADSFYVRRGAASFFTADLFFRDETAPPGDGTYWVAGVDSTGIGDSTSVVGFRPTPATAPVTVVASDTSCSLVRLDWSASAEADDYRVYRDGVLVATLPAGTLFFEDALPPGDYVYGVAAGNICGWSDSTTTTGRVLAVPSSPGALTASDTSCAVVRLDWSASADADTYAVFRNGAQIATVLAGVLSYEDAPGPGRFGYGVLAAGRCGRSAAVVDTGVVLSPPGPPATVTASIDSCGLVRVAWSAAPRADSYTVSRDGSPIVEVPHGVLFYRDLGATVGPHSYTVHSTGACGVSGESAPAAGVRPPDAPAAPAGVTASDTSCVMVLVAWQDGANETGYRVIRDGSLLADLPADSVRFPDDTAVPGFVHEYVVEAYNSCGASASGVVTGRRISGAPPAPILVAASDDLCDSVFVSWSYAGPTTEVDSFIIFYRVTGDTTWIRAGAVGVGVNIPFSFGHAQTPGSYGYRVAAANRCGISDVTGQSTDAATVRGVPGATAAVVASDDLCDHAAISWEAVAGADSFRIYRNGLLVATVSGATLTYDDVVGAGRYEYGVTAGNTCGFSEAAVDSGVVLSTAAPPESVTATDTLCGRVVVTWTASADATEYRVSRDGEILAVLPGDALAYPDTVAAGSYLYAVEAGNSCGWSATTGDSGTSVPGPTKPPFLTATDDLCGRADLAWGESAVVDTYVVFRDGIEAASVLPPLLAWSDTIAPGRHEYAVRAASPCGRSEAVVDSGAVVTPPTAPADLVASVDSCGFIRLDWTGAPFDTGYVVYRGADLLGGTGATTYRDSDASVGAHTYWVGALGLCGRSDSVSAVGVRPPDAPPAPASLAASDSTCGVVTLVWNSVVAADSFALYRDSAFVAFTADTTFADVPPDGAHLYEVEAIGRCGVSPRVADTGTLPPAALDPPAAVAATDTVCGEIDVAWDAVPDALEYRVLRDGAPFAVTAETFIADTTAPPGASYLYTVVAAGLCAESAESDTARGTRPPGTPPAPTFLTATADRCDGVALAWDDVAGEEIFVIFRNGEPLDTVAADVIAYFDTTAAAGDTAEYRVEARNRCTVPPVPFVSAPGHRRALPVAPAAVRTDSVCGGVLVGWDDTAGEDGYVVVRDSIVIDSVASDVTEYFDGGAVPGAAHAYYVGSWNACSLDPAYAAPVTGRRPYDVPATPSILSVTDDLCGAVEVRWSRSDHADEYRLYRNDSMIATISWTDLFYRDTAAVPGVLYTYRVAAANWCGATPQSAPAAGVRPPDPPAAPGGVTASNTSCKFITVGWVDVAGELGYRVYRDGNLSPIAELGPNVVEYKDSDVSSGTHTYQVEAWNGCGGRKSDPVAGERILGFPTAPEDVAASDGGCEEVVVTWTYAAADTNPVDSFRVAYRDPAAGPNWTRVGVVSPSPPFRFVHQPAPGTYEYRVLAFDECGASPETPGAVDSGTRVASPASPVLAGGDIEVCGGASFLLAWHPAPDALTYRVVEEGGGSFDGITDTSFALVRQDPGVYGFRIVAVGPCGPSEPSALRLVEVQPAAAPPEGVEATADRCGAIRISWEASETSDVWIEPAGGVRVYPSDAGAWVDSLPEGGSRTYYVGGWNACGTLAASDTVTGSALPLEIAAPVSVDASDGGCDSVLVTWEYPGSAAAVDSFRVSRLENFVYTPIAAVPATAPFAVVDRNATPGRVYLYRVRAVSKCAAAPSEPDTGFAFARPARPAWAGAATGACEGMSFTLQWAAAANADRYEISRDGDPIVVTTSTSTELSIASTGAYTFTVRGENECGFGPASDPWVVTIADAPVPPADVALDTSACDTVIVSWNPQADSVIVRRTDPPATLYRGAGDGRVVDTPTRATTYRVVSLNGCGESAAATVQLARVKARPPAPTSVTAIDASCDSVVVSWTFPTTATAVDGFRVVRSRHDTTIVVASALPPSARRFVDRAGVGTYVYEVFAFNGCGPSIGDPTSHDEGGFLPAAPRSAFTAESDSIGCRGGSFVLHWTGDPGVQNYRLWETTGGVDRFLVLLNANADSVIVEATNAGTRTFRIQAVGVCGIGDRSDEWTVVVADTPAQPSNVTATRDRCGEVVVAWRAVPATVDGVVVFRDGDEIAFVARPESTFADTNVVGGVEHAYTAAARNLCGLSASSPAAAGRSREWLAAPVLDSPDDGAEELPIPVFLSWAAVEGAVGYAVRVETAAGSVVADTAIGPVTEFAVTNLSLGGSYRWRVATRSDCGVGVPAAWRAFTTFGLAPAALASTPSFGQADVDVDVVIRVTFSVPIDSTSLGAASLSTDGVDVEGRRGLEGGGSVLVFTPNGPLAYGRSYRLEYEGLEDVFGRSFEGLAPLTFTTKPAERPFGDLDGDFQRDLVDVDLAVAMLLGRENADDYPMQRIDLNGDGRFTVADLVLLARTIVESGVSVLPGGAPPEPLAVRAGSEPGPRSGSSRLVLSFPLPAAGRSGYVEIDLGAAASDVIGVEATGDAPVEVWYETRGGLLRVLLAPTSGGVPFAESAAPAPRLAILFGGAGGPDGVRVETARFSGAGGEVRAYRGGDALPVRRAGALLLAPNRPNPFNPVTEISYYLPAPSRVRLAVYDPGGRVVATLRNGDEGAGWRTARWNGDTDLGAPAASGVYFGRLEADGVSRTIRMILVR